MLYLNAPMPVSGPSPSCAFSPLNEARASWTAFSMNSSLMRRDGCSLNTEFMSAILAELLRASALVGQFCGSNSGIKCLVLFESYCFVKLLTWKLPKQLPPGSVT